MGREAVAVVESRSGLRYGDAVWLAWGDGWKSWVPTAARIDQIAEWNHDP
jgi:hypothetical protein